MRKRLLPLLSVLMSAALVLAACATPTAAPTAVPPPPTSPPAATATSAPAAPTAVPATKAPAGPPNLTGETITFYHFGDLSGPLAAITSPTIRGAEDAAKAINDSGGIYGAKIQVKFSDTGGKVEEAVAAYNRFKSADKNMLFVITYGSGDAEALAPRLVEDKVPNLAAGLSAKAFYGKDSGYTYGLGPIYPDQLGLTMKYLKDNWAKHKPEGAGNDIKLAHISWPTAFGQGALTAESRAYLKELGVQLVLEEKYDPAPTAQTTTAILNANAAGANVIWTNTLAFGPAIILNDLNSLGLRKKFVVAADNWGMDLALYAFLAKPEYGVGLITPFPYLWWTDSSNAGIQYAGKVFADNKRPKSDQNVGYLLLVGGVDLAVKAVKKEIDTVGYKDLNGKAVNDALIALGPQDVLSGVVRVDYSKGTRAPRYAQIRQIQGGPDKFVVLQDWTEMPDLRPK
ncbi:MAG: ABC transporter substrate-binding protein [Chloroflexi bacterium]|nr:ABC transporter substrate-binding protein [Chloroflexota bacterium]